MCLLLLSSPVLLVMAANAIYLRGWEAIAGGTYARLLPDKVPPLPHHVTIRSWNCTNRPWSSTVVQDIVISSLNLLKEDFSSGQMGQVSADYMGHTCLGGVTPKQHAESAIQANNTCEG